MYQRVLVDEGRVVIYINSKRPGTGLVGSQQVAGLRTGVRLAVSASIGKGIEETI